MKKLVWRVTILGMAVALGMVVGTAAGAAEAGTNFGVGFALGDPSGLSLKIPASPVSSIDFLLGYGVDEGWNNTGDCCRDGRLYLGADYVWYNYNLIYVSQGRLPFYYGPGVWASIADHSSVGIRAALGLEYQFANAPFDVFLEISPGIRIIPNTTGDVSAGLGARYFF